MRFGSLFSGVGGMDLGLEWAEMTCAWYVEIDDYFSRVLAKHQPDIPRYGDIRDVGRHNLEPVELIVGGFPCQPHSVAGKRKGAEDDRNLWPEFSRIIGEMRPRYVLAENVPGIITTYLDTVLSDLESQGYTPWSFNIPACAFDAPHRRERIFIVAHATSKRCGETGTNRGRSEKRTPCSSPTSEDVANTHQESKSGLSEREKTPYARTRISGKDVPNTHKPSLQNGRQERSHRTFTSINGSRQSWWTVESDVGRVAHGIPSRVDRLRGLGNAVVPQVAEWIGRRIIEFDQNNN